MSALWDLLTGYIETPITINLHLSNIKEDALSEVRKVLKVMERFAQYEDGIVIHYM